MTESLHPTLTDRQLTVLASVARRSVIAGVELDLAKHVFDIVLQLRESGTHAGELNKEVKKELDGFQKACMNFSSGSLFYIENLYGKEAAHMIKYIADAGLKKEQAKKQGKRQSKKFGWKMALGYTIQALFSRLNIPFKTGENSDAVKITKLILDASGISHKKTTAKHIIDDIKKNL